MSKLRTHYHRDKGQLLQLHRLLILQLHRLLIVATAVALVALEIALFAGLAWWIVEYMDGTLNHGLTVALAAIVWSTVLTYKRMLAKCGEETLRDDPRPPVLYLRSFTEDANPDYEPSKVDFDFYTQDRMVSDLFRKIGPIVAIGRPGEHLPPLGAARIYVETGADWRVRVTELLKIAGLIIISAQKTEGLLWEIQQVVKNFPPERVILLLPHPPGISRYVGKKKFDAERLKAYERFREQAGSFFPQGLPSTIGNSNLVLFHEQWAPHIPPMCSVKSPGARGSRALLAEALRPHLSRLGMTI